MDYKKGFWVAIAIIAILLIWWIYDTMSRPKITVRNVDSANQGSFEFTVDGDPSFEKISYLNNGKYPEYGSSFFPTTSDVRITGVDKGFLITAIGKNNKVSTVYVDTDNKKVYK